MTLVEMVMTNVIDDGAGVDIEYQRFNFVTGYSRCVLISQTGKISECVKHQFRGKNDQFNPQFAPCEVQPRLPLPRF